MQISTTDHAGFGMAARRPFFRTADRAPSWITEMPAAILVGLEIVILLAGVISRYVFNAPLTWSDELASILFLWLAMLGAVVALRRGEHMRLTPLVQKMPEATRAWVTLGAELVVAAFLLQIILPTVEYFQDQLLITTPALEIQDGYRAGAIAAGGLLMMALHL